MPFRCVVTIPAMRSITTQKSARGTSSRFFSIRRNCSISVLAATWAASASVRGDRRLSRRKCRRYATRLWSSRKPWPCH
jgi:hypothetical protein